MKFSVFKEFRKNISNVNIETLVEYLSIDMAGILRELQVGLTRLGLSENMDGFIIENLSIPANTEVEIRNKMRTGIIPSYRIILRGKDGSQNVTDGDTA